ncbi:MAG: phospholipase D-like domain-containing protein, partial [Methanosarcinales archaeon]
MKFQILDNLEEEMVKAICEVIDLSKELDIAVGYFYESGYREIAQKIYDLLQRGGSVRLIIGGSPDQATAATLKALYELRNVEIRVIADRFFHSKLYIGKNDYVYILHGSSNISIGGLKHNIEFNTLNIVPIGSEMAIKTRDWFEDLWNSAIILTEDMIKYYKSIVNPKYEIIFKSEYPEELLIELEKLLKEFKIDNVNYWINNLKKFQISDPRDYTVRYFANRVKYGSVEVLGNIIPFEFQINDAMEIVERFKKGYKGVLVAHDVGLGKTITT